MAFPSPAPSPEPARPPQKNTRRRLAIGLAALLLLLLLMGVCAVVAQATTLTVSPDRVAPGGTVHVTATNVPANQAGDIELHSVVHTYPFQADAKGNVSVDIDIPFDEELGDHVVKICWDNTCHKDAPLKVVTGEVAQGSPTPSGTSPAPSASASRGAGSIVTTATLAPRAARPSASAAAVVVLPTPPAPTQMQTCLPLRRSSAPARR
jgi:hypothetical protein